MRTNLETTHAKKTSSNGDTRQEECRKGDKRQSNKREGGTSHED